VLLLLLGVLSGRPHEQSLQATPKKTACLAMLAWEVVSDFGRYALASGAEAYVIICLQPPFCSSSAWRLSVRLRELTAIGPPLTCVIRVYTSHIASLHQDRSSMYGWNPAIGQVTSVWDRLALDVLCG
jgi:hypothetical protein